MKILFYKKFTIVLSAALLCITSIKAQIPDKLKNLPFFKMRALMLESLRKPHAPGKLNNMHSSSDAPCLKAQTTLGGSNYDQGSKMIETRDGGFIVCGLTFSNDGDLKQRTPLTEMHTLPNTTGSENVNGLKLTVVPAMMFLMI